MDTRSRSAWKLALAALLGGLLFLAVAAPAAVAAYQLAYADAFYPGVRVAGVEVGGLTVEQARPLVAARMGQELEREVVLAYGQERWVLPLSELGLQADVEAALTAGLAVGREDDLLASLSRQWQAWSQGVEVEGRWIVSEGHSLVTLGRLARHIERPAVDGELRLDGTQIVTVEPRVGLSLDLEASGERLLEAVASRSGGTVELVVREVPPLVREVDAARQILETMLAPRLLLTARLDHWDAEGEWVEEALVQEVGREDRARFVLIGQRRNADGSIRLEPRWSREGMEDYVARLAPRIDQELLEGRYRFDRQAGHAVPVVPGQEGRELDVPAAADALYAALLQGREQLELPVRREIPPSWLTGPEARQIVELAAQGTTSYRGSSAARETNIKVASARYHGLVIRPGAVFSFGQYLGEVTEDEGYVVGLIIQGSETVEGLGGGICQVSTTMYRAAFFGGYPIEERWPHAYRLGYYEPPVGLDATVYTPVVDMKFLNDQETPLLVHTFVDGQRKTVTFQLYGVRPPRRVELEGPYVSNVVPHPEPLYIEDPKMPSGEVKQVDWATEGMDVMVYRLIYDLEGELVSREPYFSRYRAWQAKYLVGTGQAAAASGGGGG